MANKIVFREDGCILIKDVRLSYPHLFKAWAKNPDKETPKFSARFLMDKKGHAEEIKLLGGHINKMMQDAFKGRIASNALFMRNGADSGKPEFEESWIVATGESRKPDVINKDKTPVREEDDIVYAGCYVNVLLRPWVQNNIHGKRINANLLAVQFVRDGERFGAERPDVDEAFEVEGNFEDDHVGDLSDDEDPFA